MPIVELNSSTLSIGGTQLQIGPDPSDADLNSIDLSHKVTTSLTSKLSEIFISILVLMRLYFL